MKYLQPSFTIEKPAQIRGCEACIYGEAHGYEHTLGDGCSASKCDDCGYVTTDAAAMFAHCCQ